jgi:hypothetical protein
MHWPLCVWKSVYRALSRAKYFRRWRAGNAIKDPTGGQTDGKREREPDIKIARVTETAGNHGSALADLSQEPAN